MENCSLSCLGEYLCGFTFRVLPLVARFNMHAHVDHVDCSSDSSSHLGWYVLMIAPHEKSPYGSSSRDVNINLTCGVDVREHVIINLPNS